MRWELILLTAVLGCRPASNTSDTVPSAATAGAVEARSAPPTLPSPAPIAGVVRPPETPRSVRVYVAGESIERRVRWVERPLLKDGRLNERGASRNGDDEYGWVVPFADRLAIRAPGLSVAWVGTERWLGHDDEAYDGTYPSSTPGATSAIAGTSIEGWLEKRRGELEKKRHCYDLAIAARGGNDFENDDESTASQLAELFRLLAGGSSCKASPLIVVTGHMPDDQRGGKGPGDAAYVAKQKHQFVERFRAAAALARGQGLRVGFVDAYGPFLENRKTTAFPAEVWARNGVPDFAKIGREGDRMHPRRLASIYVGEIVADSIDLAELAR